MRIKPHQTTTCNFHESGFRTDPEVSFVELNPPSSPFINSFITGSQKWVGGGTPLYVGVADEWPWQSCGGPMRQGFGEKALNSPFDSPHDSPLLEPFLGRDANDRVQDHSRTDFRAVYTPFLRASGDILSFPHLSNCLHCRLALQPAEARWGTGLCDPCYSKCERNCQLCGNELALKQLHWMSGICNMCARPQEPSLPHSRRRRHRPHRPPPACIISPTALELITPPTCEQQCRCCPRAESAQRPPQVL